MRAVYVETAQPDDPLAALKIGERPEPVPSDGWVVVEVEAAALNRHDLWSLAGVGLPASRMPMILGTDAAGAVDGRPVLVHAVIATPGWVGDETLDRSVRCCRSCIRARWRSGSVCRGPTWSTGPSGCRPTRQPACPRRG